MVIETIYILRAAADAQRFFVHTLILLLHTLYVLFTIDAPIGFL